MATPCAARLVPSVVERPDLLGDGRDEHSRPGPVDERRAALAANAGSSATGMTPRVSARRSPAAVGSASTATVGWSAAASAREHRDARPDPPAPVTATVVIVGRSSAGAIHRTPSVGADERTAPGGSVGARSLGGPCPFGWARPCGAERPGGGRPVARVGGGAAHVRQPRHGGTELGDLARDAELLGGPAAQLARRGGARRLPLAAGDAERDRQTHAVVRLVGHGAEHGPRGRRSPRSMSSLPGSGAVGGVVRTAQPALQAGQLVVSGDRAPQQGEHDRCGAARDQEELGVSWTFAYSFKSVRLLGSSTQR